MIKEGQRSKVGGEVCALLSPNSSSVYCKAESFSYRPTERSLRPES